MRRLKIAEVEIRRLAVQREITRSEDSRYDHRWRPLTGALLVSRSLVSNLGRVRVDVRAKVSQHDQRVPPRLVLKHHPCVGCFIRDKHLVLGQLPETDHCRAIEG